jgi:hypothetical protein
MINTERRYLERKGGYWSNFIDTSWHETGSEIIDTRMHKEMVGRNVKSETRSPEPGSQVNIVLDGTTLHAVSSREGTVVFDETLSPQIAQAAKNIKSFEKIKVEVPSLNLAGEIDVSKAGFIVEIVSETQGQIAPHKNSVTNSSSYESFAKSLAALKDKMRYPFQIALLGSELKDTGNQLLEKFSAEIAPILNRFPEFLINGRVKDYFEGPTYTTFDIWGRAYPQPMTETTSRSLGFRGGEDSNLRVVIKNSTKNSDTVAWRGNSIVIQGKVFYVGRDSGTNAYGGSVPVFNYTDILSQVPGLGEQGSKLQSINSQIDAVQKTYNEYSALF